MLNGPCCALREAYLSPYLFNPLALDLAPLVGSPNDIYTAQTEVPCSSEPLECLHF